MQALIERQFHGRPLIVSWSVSYNMILTESRVVGFNCTPYWTFVSRLDDALSQQLVGLIERPGLDACRLMVDELRMESLAAANHRWQED